MKKLVLLGVVFLLSSCYSVKIYSGKTNQKTPVVKTLSKKNHHFIFGIVSPRSLAKLQVYESTPNKNYVVETKQTIVDFFVDLLTGGVYTPTTTTLYLPYPVVDKE